MPSESFSIIGNNYSSPQVSPSSDPSKKLRREYWDYGLGLLTGWAVKMECVSKMTAH